MTAVAVDADKPLSADAQGADLAVLSFALTQRLDEVVGSLAGARVVQTLSAGVEWLLPHVPPDVTVCNASGAHDAAVSEWCVAAILAMERRLLEFRELQRDRHWERNVNDVTAAEPSPLTPIHDLDGRSVLIVGHGSIGRALEARLRVFGARVDGVARTARGSVRSADHLPDLVPRADVVVLLLPLTAETERLVDESFLGRMRPGSLLVNAARGRLVDTDALERALREHRIRAALDTTDPEPLPQQHTLWGAPGLLITPHVAGSTLRWRGRAHRFAGDQIRRLAAGEPLRNVRDGY